MRVKHVTKEQLADAMNALPNIDPHDDEEWMVDRVWEALKDKVELHATT